jgi:hypothetical protein
LERKEDDRKLAISVCVSTGAVEHNKMSQSILEIRRLGKYNEEIGPFLSKSAEAI